MSHFKNGEYGNNIYIVKPIGRSKFGSFSLPYFVATKIEWSIEILPKGASSTPLREFEIYEDVPPYELKRITSHSHLSDNDLKFNFVNERIVARKGKVEYWLGEPGGKNSLLLVSADILHGDTVFFIVAASAISVVLGFFLGLLTK